jgi:hypothetical protein
VSLPIFSPRSPPPQTVDPQARLSRITELTEESRPISIAASATSLSRPANPTPDGLRRSAILGVGSASHSCASVEPGPDPTLPSPGRLNELRAVFESQSPAGPRAASTPGFRSSSPMPGANTLTSATGYAMVAPVIHRAFHLLPSLERVFLIIYWYKSTVPPTHKTNNNQRVSFHSQCHHSY